MSIDGATKLDEVDSRAWLRLAQEVGVSARFLKQRVGPFVDLTQVAARELARDPEFASPPVERIVEGIGARAERGWPEGHR